MGPSTPVPLVSPLDHPDARSGLPPPPRVVRRLLAEATAPGAEEAARILREDPALTRDVLRLVSLTCPAVPRPVTDLRFAMAFLGAEELIRLATVAATVGALKPAGFDGEAQLRGLWRQAFMTTLAARQVCRLLPGVENGVELCAAALLHHLGRVVHLFSDRERYVESAVLAMEEGILLAEAEARMGMRSHKKVGGDLARQWALPRSVERAASFHDLDDLRTLPGERRASPYDLAICVGHLLAELHLRAFHDELAEAIAAETQRVLAIDEEAFVYLLGQGEEWQLHAEHLLRDAV